MTKTVFRIEETPENLIAHEAVEQLRMVPNFIELGEQAEIRRERVLAEFGDQARPLAIVGNVALNGSGNLLSFRPVRGEATYSLIALNSMFRQPDDFLDSRSIYRLSSANPRTLPFTNINRALDPKEDFFVRYALGGNNSYYQLAANVYPIDVRPDEEIRRNKIFAVSQLPPIIPIEEDQAPVIYEGPKIPSTPAEVEAYFDDEWLDKFFGRNDDGSDQAVQKASEAIVNGSKLGGLDVLETAMKNERRKKITRNLDVEGHNDFTHNYFQQQRERNPDSTLAVNKIIITDDMTVTGNGYPMAETDIATDLFEQLLENYQGAVSIDDILAPMDEEHREWTIRYIARLERHSLIAVLRNAESTIAVLRPCFVTDNRDLGERSAQ